MACLRNSSANSGFPFTSTWSHQGSVMEWPASWNTFAAALAFYKVNDKPFINMVEAFVKYTLTNKLYIWKKEEKQVVRSMKQGEGDDIEQVYVPKLSDSKLKELTWSLDIKENENPVTSNNNEPKV